MRDMVQEVFGVMPLPTRCCGNCRSWTRKQPDDMTAPEGKCGLKKEPPFYPFGYWPSTLQRDLCSYFQPPKTN